MALDFGGLDIFGTPEKTRVIFMKLKEEGSQYELLLDITHVIISSCLNYGLIEFSELSHIN